ncbi:glycoside hydrolase family 43 protein [Saccharopolyspora flava]|uniref:Beta-xylosidase, GH43 family n=1 Tax=Saccharopolyspora flava TaxID=95161 RepID=A0A1I6TJS1_9PSEU|nr:glycoside hydrolase family 43 protein [Saccharopolyspora flava]SFS89406.1 Beta-xylosidase, GH43 family [Saccharopolyspora flava]
MHELSRRGVLAGALAAGAVAALPGSAAGAAGYPNPLLRQRADPHVLRHSDGFYYCTATVPEYDRIVLRRARTIGDLSTASESVLWRRHESGEMGGYIWAPEIHRVDGRWYLYFAAGRSEDFFDIRMYVLENAAADPFTGTWVEKGQIVTAWDTFALDATTFTHGGTRYLAWAQREPGINTNSNLYLAPMSDPWTLAGTPARLSTPTYEWETRGYAVNEAPAVIERNGRVFVAYSASATDSNYCMGLLTAESFSDLLDPASWTKASEPVFTSSDATGQYGPGHNSFTVAEDGRTDVLVYHARPYEHVDGDPLFDPNRHTRAQPFTWKPDGTPDFGVPVADSRA